MLLPDEIHPSWEAFLTEDIKKELTSIEEKIGKQFNPKKPKNILRFLSLDIDQMEVVWLGQDVYPAEGVATGRSFEVGGLANWNEPFRQVSVKNIIRLIHKTYFGIEEYENIKRFNDIKVDIHNNVFRIKQPEEWFDSLEQQGVLFLNTSFTCRVGKPNSHKKIWDYFSKKVLEYIASNNPGLTWFLWGKEAKEYKKYINQGFFYESRHPMMCSNKYPDDFLKSPCFKDTMQLIDWLG